MKKLAAALGMVLCFGFAQADEVLNGEYLWVGPDVDGDLEATFVPKSESSYEVTFRFDFRDEPRVYTGTATGSLERGELRGTVKNENKKRTFEFEGEFGKDGVFRGKHRELVDDGVKETGTLTLSR